MLKPFLLLCVSLAAAPALADENILCTGLGLDARVEAEAFPHNLRLVHAARSGEYLGAVRTRVEGPGGVVVDQVCDGPWLLLDLPPGTYTVSSTYLGQTKRIRVRAARRRVRRIISF